MLFVRLYWEWFQSRRPSVRFRALSPMIETVMRRVVDDLAHSDKAGSEPFVSSSTRAAARDLAYRLNDFKVPYPPLNEPKALDVWCEFLIRALAAARVGKLKQARSLLREIEEGTGSMQDGGGE